MSAALYAISPLDGRYRSRLNGVSTYLSEYAYIKYRIRVEIGSLSGRVEEWKRKYGA